MISGAGSFAAILHRHRSADRLRKTVFVLAGCTEDMFAAFRATVDTGRNSPRHVADASDKFLLAIGTYKDSASGRPCRNFAGGVIVFVAPHSSDLWTLGNQIVDARDNLATCTNRATGVAVAYRFNNTVDGSRELLPAVGANEEHFLLLFADTSLGVKAFLVLHIAEIFGHLVATSLMPGIAFLELIVLAFIANSLSPRIFEACKIKIAAIIFVLIKRDDNCFIYEQTACSRMSCWDWIEWLTAN